MDEHAEGRRCLSTRLDVGILRGSVFVEMRGKVEWVRLSLSPAGARDMAGILTRLAETVDYIAHVAEIDKGEGRDDGATD